MKEIVFENVSKTYGKTQVVKDLNLTIKAGERLILLGPSGCGKSTTLRMIAGLEGVTSGQIYMDGKCVNDVESGERNVAMVFQNYALFPHMTVEDNITYGLKVHKLPQEALNERLNTVLEMLQLRGLEKRKPKDLSGGQRQRVALARAVVKRADYFLLDEPLSNLDAQLRGHARKELVKIHEMYKQTLVYVTHDQVEAMTVGDRIALMYQGHLQMVGTPHNVYNKPANVFTAKFIGSPAMNIMKAAYRLGAIHIGNQKVELGTEWVKHLKQCKQFLFLLGLRPEHIKLSAYAKSNTIEGTVKYIEDYGNRYAVYFEVEGEELIAMCDEQDFEAGNKVYFEIDPKKMHLFDEYTTESIGYPEEVR